MRREVLICLLLAGITLGLYWPATQCDFIRFDDQEYVTENAQVQSGLTLANIAWAFSTPVSSNWHPLTMLSHMLDCQLFGLQPQGHHLTSLLLHTLNTVLVFVLLRRLTHRLWRSVAVAALFGWHPLHVESVAWVAERKDVLSTLFFLLSLLAYARYVHNAESRKQKAETGGHFPSAILEPLSSPAYWLSLSCFALGLMCKSMLVTLPFVLLLLDYWPLGRFMIYDLRFTISPPAPGSGTESALPIPHSALRTPHFLRLLTEKLPFFALSAAASAVTFAVQSHSGAVASMETLPLGARLGNALISYGRYLGKLFWPADLAIFYPHPGVWPLASVILAAAFLTGVSVLFFRLRNRQPWLLMGWAWFLGTLVPVIGLVQVGKQSMADRYTYIPSLGVFVLTVWGACESCRCREQPEKRSAGSFTGCWMLNVECWMFARCFPLAAALVLCCLLTRQQLGYWRNSESLFHHALAVTENNAWALDNLGFVVVNQGRTDEAINYYRQALRLKPAAYDLHNNLGIALLAKGLTDAAIHESEAALRLQPDFASAHFNLGNAFSKQGRLEEAIAQFREGIRIEPGDAPSHVSLGAALYNQGRTDEAINEFHAAMRLQPATAELHNNLAIALLAKGLADEAVVESQAAIRLRPDFAPARLNLGNAFVKRGQIDQAIAQFQTAVRLAPADHTGRINLGVALLSQGRLEEAITDFLAAIRLKPDASKAHYNLGLAYLQKGQLDPAILQLKETLRLKPDDPDAKRDLARAVELRNQPDVPALDPAALNNLAWALATRSEAVNRDGPRAVKLAEDACRQTQYQQTVMVGTLAAAYAEAGRFDDAIATAQKACALAVEHGETNLLARNQELLAGYQKHQPYHEAAGDPVP